MKALIEKQNKLIAKQKNLDGIYKEAGDNTDLSLVKSNGFPELGNTAARVKRITELDAEMNDLGKEIENLMAVEKAKKTNEDRAKMFKTAVDSVVHPKGDGAIVGKHGQIIQPKGLGQLFVESKAYTERSGNEGPEAKFYGDRNMNLKTLFETTAGFAPESVRSGLILPAVSRPLQMTDVVPSGAINQAVEVYMEQTTRTSTAAETAEGGTYNEATFVYTERTESVRKITISLPVTDEQLEDEARISSIIQDDLMLMLKQRLDTQLLNGDGTGVNLTGYVNKSGILTQAKGVDTALDAIYKLMTQIRVTGRAFPSAVCLHPNDWQEIRLLKTSDGIYLYGSPAEAGPERIFGLPLVQADALTEGTGVVGDFANPTYSQLLIKKGITLKISDSHDTYFTAGKQMIRADIRAAFVIRRAAAFGTVTGI